MTSSSFSLDPSHFHARFRNSTKYEDFFNRGYTLCMDTTTNKRAILKFYSIQTSEQYEAVMQNMANFEKLSHKEGICRLLAYTAAREKKQLTSAYEFHPQTLGEFVDAIKQNRMPLGKRLRFYVDIIEQVADLVNSCLQTGIELDQINRSSLVVKQNPYFNQLSSSSLSIQAIAEFAYSCSILYDEREKQYRPIESGHLVQPNNNKLYWSADKIRQQALKGNDYSMAEGQESIYQLGLMMLDVIYEVEKFMSEADLPSRSENDLQPDEAAALAEGKLSYYMVDAAKKLVHRNQALIAQRINFLIYKNDVCLEGIGLLLKKMISPILQSRTTISEVIEESNKIREQLNSYRTENNHQNNQSNKRTQLYSVQSLNEQQVHAISSQTIQSIASSKGTIPHDQEAANYDSTQIKKIHAEVFKRNSQPSITIAAQSQTNKPQNSGNGERFSVRSVESGSALLNGQQIMNMCKIHHVELRNSLQSAITQLNEVKKQHPEQVVRKQYFDGSFYFGCIDHATKKRKGLGIYVYKNGDIYFGGWEDSVLTNGAYLFKNGESFEGTANKGKNGQGIYRYSNGNVYKGIWKDDLKNGKGAMFYPSGAKYEGQWLKGKKHGEGTYFYENGIRYNGGFALGKKYGHGVFHFPNGTRVQGFWQDNHLEGLAKVYYHNGDYYQGNFHMSEKTGEGVYRWVGDEQGDIEYKGEFKKDCLEGSAVIRFTNGEIYQGSVRNGKRQGQGTYRYQNGDIFKGEWKKDEKVAGKYSFYTGDEFEGRFKDSQMTYGTMHYSNGEIYKGEFHRGERHGMGAYSNKLGQLIYEGQWEHDAFVSKN